MHVLEARFRLLGQMFWPSVPTTMFLLPESGTRQVTPGIPQGPSGHLDRWCTGEGLSLLDIRGGTRGEPWQKNGLHLKSKCNQLAGTECLQVLGHRLDLEQGKHWWEPGRAWVRQTPARDVRNGRVALCLREDSSETGDEMERDR